MYAYLTGYVTKILYTGIVYLDVNGVGYELNVSNNTLIELRDKPDRVTVYTYMQVREDAITLFGFATPEEKEAFLMLCSVSGVGAKMALAVLSGLSVQSLRRVITTGAVRELCSVKGLGKKTAERIILELKDKLQGAIDLFNIDEILAAEQTAENNAKLFDDALTLLMQLGFAKTVATPVVKEAVKKYDSLDEVVTLCLQKLNN